MRLPKIHSGYQAKSTEVSMVAMMEQMRLGATGPPPGGVAALAKNKEEEDDLYSGYNEYPEALNTKDLHQDEGFQQAIKTSHGRRPTATPRVPSTAMRLGTASGYRAGATGTGLRTAMASRAGMQTGDMDVARPITAVRGAGYTSSQNRTPGQKLFDPLNLAAKGTGPAPPLELKLDESPEGKIRQLERKVNDLIEESILFAKKGDARTALERAKEASAKEKSLIRMRDQIGLKDGHNMDMTFNVAFNLASAYTVNEMYVEALSTYQAITKNRMFSNAGRLKLNMGNIYFKQGQYAKAIKLYRMALDQVPNTHKELRLKIMHNIGSLFVKMGQYGDAATSFEYIMQEKPDHKTGLNLILCYYSLGDREKMKKGFQAMLEVPQCLGRDDEDKYHLVGGEDPLQRAIIETVKNDSYSQFQRRRKESTVYSVLTSAKLISPVLGSPAVEGNENGEGHDWCVEAVKASGGPFSNLAGDLEINRAVSLMKKRDFVSAAETLRAFEKRKEAKVAGAAATNLTFLHFLQGDYEQAEKYGEQARQADPYSAGAFVNLGNCAFIHGDVEKAREMYVVALENDSSCVEALFNLGLSDKRMAMYEEALQSFEKLRHIVHNHPQVLYQVAHLHELMGEREQAVEWYLQVLGVVASDPSILHRLGQLYDKDGDKQQSYHYHFDSYRYYPSNLEVIEWLGSYFVEMQVAEKAIAYFERAALMQPDDPRWPLTVASCHRRSGSYHRALETYRRVHRRFPENLECLRFLIRICNDMGLKEAADYANELKQAEKAKAARERAASSRPGSRRVGSRSGSAASVANSAGLVRSTPGSALSLGRETSLSLDDDEDFLAAKTKEVDASYSDPIGPLVERPKTSMGRGVKPEEEFAEGEGQDLLPE